MNLRTELIRTSEQWEKLQEFAWSFDHEINRSLSYVVFKDVNDNWLAYLALVMTPVGIPAIHPDAGGRVALEVAKQMEGYSKINYGQAFVLIPSDSPFKDYLKKQGFVDQGLQLFHAE